VSGGSEGTLIGIVGRVTVSIPARGPDEVLLPVRGGSEAFARTVGVDATARDPVAHRVPS
jgi:hypothetical protein